METTSDDSFVNEGGSIDISRAPLGERAAAALVAAIAAGDDRLERYYLEVKGHLDLTTKVDLAKIAKFILGAANRQPAIAASAFEGYGVMVIGVSPGDIHGVPPIEMLEIDKAVSKYLGASGPHWDLVRVPIKDSPNEVLLVLVDPPAVGQGPFLCRRDGDGLIDGRVYIRADGATREAKADEVDQLLERGRRQAAPDVAFEVKLVGSAHPLEVDNDATLEDYIGATSSRLLAPLKPKPAPKAEPATSAVGYSAATALGLQNAAFRQDFAKLREMAQAASSATSFMGTDPETRTEEEYRASIEKWETRLRTRWPNALDALASRVLDGVAIRIENPTKTFFHDVKVEIHLEGEVKGLDYFGDSDSVSFSDLDLPSPPRIWGPTVRQPFDTAFRHASSYMPSLPSTYRSPLDWRNSGSVDLTLNVGELRPRGVFTFDDDELILVLPPTSEAQIHGTWEITARDHNEVYSGELHVNVGAPVDLTSALRKLLKLDD